VDHDSSSADAVDTVIVLMWGSAPKKGIPTFELDLAFRFRGSLGIAIIKTSGGTIDA
jgi:hypothetical protein